MQTPSKISLDAGRGSRGEHRLELDGASAAEMREFLAQMSELHPQNVVGVGAPGGLLGGMIAATVGTVILMAALTVGPYAWQVALGQPDNLSAPVVAAEKTDAPNTTEKAEKPPAAPAAQAAAEQPAGEKKPAAPPEPSQPLVSKSTLERLGVDEVKTADPNVNPLDSKLDDLLDKAK